MLNMQALIIAYANDFRMLTFFALCALPVAFIIGPTKATFSERFDAPPPAGPPQQQRPPPRKAARANRRNSDHAACCAARRRLSRAP